ncbi:stage II sporulation protein M [Chengkuizengella sp. SCS-71B]|uniref:stage II sporulation protein M n=1 Tax=Chengkuizengella sp. SCS-71B TaxID=3115290 RepID=UPI0032C249D4
MNDENYKIHKEEKLNNVTTSKNEFKSNSDKISLFLKEVLNFKNLFVNFKEMKVYFYISTLLFVVGIITGFNSETVEQFIQQSIQGLEEKARDIQASDNPHVTAFIIIFTNNVKVSLIAIYSGFFFSLFPVFLLLTNGMAIGYLFKLIPQSGSEFGMFELFLRGILPHGIFEIPAILIASAYGIKFGVLIMKWLIQSGNNDLRAKNKIEFIAFMKLLVTLVIFTVATLMLAAIIESTITPILLS